MVMTLEQRCAHISAFADELALEWALVYLERRGPIPNSLLAAAGGPVTKERCDCCGLDWGLGWIWFREDGSTRCLRCETTALFRKAGRAV